MMREEQEQALTTIESSTELETTIGGWLHEKKQRSNSEKTVKAYRDTLLQFRALLQERGLDLERQANDQDVVQVAMLAQAYASFSTRPGHAVKGATINQRFAILSSFYEYARIKKCVKLNPIKEAGIKRAKVQAYARARAIDKDVTKEAFSSIDRKTTQGKRDYALLSVFLQTGRRLQEVATLQMQHLTLRKGKITVSFEHCKGDKEMRDTLSLPVSKAVLAWLHDLYGASLQLGVKDDTRPVWVSLAQGGRNGKSYGRPLGPQAIADVCQKYLGTSKVHDMRHTFAHLMQEAGANVSEIQARLGHESIATTGRYLAQLKQDENKYGDLLAEMLGIR